MEGVDFGRYALWHWERLMNGSTDRVQVYFVLRDQTAMHVTKAMVGVHACAHMRRSLFVSRERLDGLHCNLVCDDGLRVLSGLRFAQVKA